jgi:hypothetical protein
MWTYSQSTGQLTDSDGNIVGTGYAGAQPHVNDPSAQNLPNIGPLPRGSYQIGTSFTHPLAGPMTMRLTALAPTDTFGRDGFMIHGDTPSLDQTASEGCIIMARSVRSLISLSTDKVLTVSL